MTGRSFFSIFVLLSLFLSACGWMEVPYQRAGTRLDAGSSTGARASDTLFIGADTVTVGRGDTVYAIAKRHQVSMRAIIRANNLRAPYVLKIGDKMVLPRDRLYAVKSGDTLSGVAEKTRVSLFELARLNGLKAPYVIHPGENLRLPLPGQTRAQVAGKPKVSVGASTRISPSRKSSVSLSFKVPPRTGGTFLWPVRGRVVSGFGPQTKGQQNDGINIVAPRGTLVKVAENGVVAYAGDGIKGFGSLVLVRHAGGWVTAYAHTDQVLVKRGEQVKRGQNIARVGSTGTVTVPQLHFEIRKRGKAVDPKKYLG